MSRPRIVTVVCHGDSLTRSQRSVPQKQLVHLLEDKLRSKLGDGWRVNCVNCGVGGQPARDGLARFERDVLAYDPDIVLLEFGGNDANTSNPEEFEGCLRRLIERTRDESGALPLLWFMPRLIDGLHHSGKDPERVAYGGSEKYVDDLFHDPARRLAEELRVAVCDSFRIYHEEMTEDPGMDERLIRADGIHLTPEGNEWVAEKIADALEPVIRALPDAEPESLVYGPLPEYSEPMFAYRGIFMEDKWGPDLMELRDWQDIVDWMADHGMNVLTVGLYGCWCVQYDDQITEFLMVPVPGHPEIKSEKTIRWYSARDDEWKSLTYLPPMFEQDFLGELVAYGQERGVEVFPLFNSLGHNTLIPRHIPEISSLDEAGNPTGYGYCLSNPETLTTVGGWYQQIWKKYFAPHGVRHFHLGLDEVYSSVGCDPADWYRQLDPWCQCDQCRQKPDEELFIDYVVGLAKMLREAGVERVVLWNDQMTRHMSFIDKFTERVEQEGLEDHVVVEFWWYSPDGIHESVHPRLAEGLPTWVMPIASYFNWSRYGSNLDNIGLMTRLGEAEGAEGLHAYSVWDWAQEPEFTLLAECGWHGPRAVDDFLSRYCAERFGEDGPAVKTAINLLREAAANPSLALTNYYRYTYLKPDKPYPRPYPESALEELVAQVSGDGEPRDLPADFRRVRSLCRTARWHLETVADQSDRVVRSLVAELWRCQALAESFDMLLQADNLEKAFLTDPDCYRYAEQVVPGFRQYARELILQAMGEIERREPPYMVPSVLRDLSVLLASLE